MPTDNEINNTVIKISSTPFETDKTLTPRDRDLLNSLTRLRLIYLYKTVSDTPFYRSVFVANRIFLIRSEIASRTRNRK